MPTFTLAQALKLAITHHQAGRVTEAEEIYQQILAQQPNHPDALHLLGVIAGQAGRMDQAEELIGRAITVAPEHAIFCMNLGRLNLQAGRVERAVALQERAVQVAPHSAEAWFELGKALEAAQQPDKAVEAHQAAVKLEPGYARAWLNLGMLLRARGQLDPARQCLERAVAAQPDMVEARGNLGTVLEAQGRYAEAIEQYREALPLAPGHFMLHYNMGVSLSELGRHEEATASYRRAIELNPEYPPAHNNLGNTLKYLGRFDEAIVAYRRAVELKGDLSEAYCNLAAILESRAEHAEAWACNQRAVALRPEHAVTHGNLCYTMLFLPEFDPAAIAAELGEWNRRHGAPLRGVRRGHGNARDPERRLRIGYVSPDFRDHVIARNMVPALRDRDRQQIEVFCYSNLTLKDARTAWFVQACDHWREIWGVEDARVEEQMRADGIDILVDLTLHMAGNRLGVLARKPAPIQVTFAGYPGSTGLESMDYRLTDACLDPPEGPRVFVEESMRLASFWCYDPLGVKVDVNDLPAAQTGPITFGCLNHFCKVNDGVLDLWSQVLGAVPGSRLMLLCAEGSHRGRTLHYLAGRGIAAERITFLAPRPRAEYLAMYHHMDIGLDTLPYNGHTTSLDALWMGVPVVTLVGRTEAGRAGLSQLTHLGMPELIAREPGEYVRIAVELARDRPRLAAYRAGLRQRMERSVLMDGVAFARGLEAAYREMWRKWCRP